jgi:hypothetical protein
MKREIVFALLLGALLMTPPVLALHAQEQSAGSPDLVAALKGTPGCYGVETARTASGKQVIFAWFENKKALLAWYYSPVHQHLMSQFFPTAAPRTPLGAIEDDGRPILAVASLTMADQPASSVTSLPISQIGIELYQPLPGGIALGGRFSPSTMKVPGLTEIPFPGK